jgi:small subunit ribosomal protein S3
LSKIVDGELQINIKEIKVPEVDAQLVAEDIANQILRRAAVKRTMKQAASRAIKMKAEGIKIMISGRIGGAEIARTEWHMEGRLPLHTLRADIDYGFSEANTTYGKIGIKVWIFKGEVLPGSISSERISDTSEETKKDKIEASLENDLPEKERLREEKNASTN